jgi:NADH-quinone oxidoreductase subunit M
MMNTAVTDAPLASIAEFPYLTLLTVLPLVGAVVLAMLPRTASGLAKVVALVFALAELGLGGAAWLAYDAGGTRLQLRESYQWIPTWDARFTFAVDGIALVMIALVVVFVPLVIVYSW